MSERSKHSAIESSVQRRSREGRSLAWLAFLDSDAKFVYGSWFVAPLGLVLLVAGIIEGQVWMIVDGPIFGIIATTVLVTHFRSRRG